MKDLLAQLATGRPLSVKQAAEAFQTVMQGEATDPQLAALLGMIQVRGPRETELIGAAQVMRTLATPVMVPPGITVIDTCGTGGDHAQTFNISTAAAIVASGAARPHNVAVAKHGNRAVTSKSGSSQALEALGVKLQVKGPTLTRCLDEAGICFCFAPSHHPAMKHAAGVRQDLGFRTIFNLLGPLTNPAGATRQVVGIFAPELTETIATVLQQLGSQHAMVVHGLPAGQPAGATAAGIDELTTSGPSRISHLNKGAIHTYELEATELGLTLGHPAALLADGPAASVKIIRTVLAGKHGPARDIVCLNAAAALVVADVSADLSDGLRLASESIDTGAADKALSTLVTITNEDGS